MLRLTIISPNLASRVPQITIGRNFSGLGGEEYKLTFVKSLFAELTFVYAQVEKIEFSQIRPHAQIIKALEKEKKSRNFFSPPPNDPSL